jgi:L-threonylcarbamoyladenylate synthase
MAPPHRTTTTISIVGMTSSSVDIENATTSTAPTPQALQSQLAKLVPATLPSLTTAGERLRSGHLVSFPTETVYGLGCHALDPVAVQRVFDAKERPLSDPLIVHVVRGEDALELWDASSATSPDTDDGEQTSQQIQQMQQLEKQVLQTLTASFFPGPLTIVAKAKPSIPQILMANTGYVACRSPSHPIARALIKCAKCPIAAPSANKFGHVSPTLARHVMDDLGREDVWIVDPLLGVELGDDEDVVSVGVEDKSDGAVCQVGVESTVAKVEMNSDNNGEQDNGIVGSITVLRHGAISSAAIRVALKQSNLDQYFDVKDAVQYTPENVNNVAPGQTVKHYSPNVPCFMVGSSRQQSADTTAVVTEEEKSILSQSVIIDYAQSLLHYQPHALAYRDLSTDGNSNIAASNVFAVLRWSESIEGAIRVFVPEIVLEDGEEEGRSVGGKGEGALVLAVKDKLTRAASGVVVDKFK